MDAHLGEKDLHKADEAAEGEAEVGNDALDLMELGQMGGVDGLVAEDAVDGEVTGRSRVGGQAVQHVGGYGGRVRAQDEAQGFRVFEGVPVADGAVFAAFVHLFDVCPVLGVVEGLSVFLVLGEEGGGAVWEVGWWVGVDAGFVGLRWVGDVECVLEVAGGVLLGDEEGVEVPEAGFDVAVVVKDRSGERLGIILPIRRHLFETHVKENLSEFVPDFVYYYDKLSVNAVSVAH